MRTSNPEYRKKMDEAIMDAVIKAAAIDTPGGRKALLDANDITMACLAMIAFVSGSSERTSSAKKTRDFCDDVAQTLRRMISEMRRAHETGEMDHITTINNPKDEEPN